MSPTFWQGKRVFITGHTGFKGSWLCMLLREYGAELAGYSLPPPTQPSLFEAVGLASEMRSVTGDVRDLAHLEEEVRRQAPSVVIHMAAQALVRRSYAEPVETYATNVLGTVNLLEAVRRAGGVRAVVIVTSDKCYENLEHGRPYQEGDAMGGYDPYSSSKGCAELVTAAYRKSFFQAGTGIASARAGNVVGGGDWSEDRLIPDIVRAFLKREPVSIRKPDAVRPWQHVLDCLAGYVSLAEALTTDPARYAGPWNFGPLDLEGCRPVGWIVERMVQLWGEGASWRREEAPQPHEAQFLHLDAAKAHLGLGWEPRWDLERTLAMTVAWYRAFRGKQDLRRLSREQIQVHAEAAKKAGTAR